MHTIMPGKLVFCPYLQIIDGRETAFNGFGSSFTTSTELLKITKPNKNYCANRSRQQ